MASAAISSSIGVNAYAAASSGDGNCPGRPVLICTMLSAVEPDSHRASWVLGAQITETATITRGSRSTIDG